MTDSFSCVNCAAGEPMAKPPFPNAYGRDIQSKVCESCWNEWKGLEVMLVNEYKLNLLERKDRTHLRENMKDFLNLSGAREPGAKTDFRPKEYTEPGA